MVDINKQLKKGVLSILILEMISIKDRYGYELIQELDVASSGYYKLKEGSLYPVFYRLEDDGLIESYKVEIGEKRKVPRKYYKITELGQTRLKEMKNAWNEFSKITTTIIGGSNE